jgi:hypothetical protein
VALAEARSRVALQYLIAIVIEEQPRHRDVILRLEQRPSESELRAHVEGAPSGNRGSTHEPAIATLHNVQLSIARRLLESAGASRYSPATIVPGSCSASRGLLAHLHWKSSRDSFPSRV